MKPKYLLLAYAALLSGLPAVAAETGNLRVGAAKVDITPPLPMAKALKNVWGTLYEGIHDRIYVRAIVLDNGRTSAALVSIDTSSTPLTLPLRQRIEK